MRTKHSTILKKRLSDARYRHFTCRLAMQHRNSQRNITTEPTNNRRMIDKKPFITKAGHIQLHNKPEEIDRNFSFSGTDNGIVKMTETVPLNLERFSYHF